MDPETGEYPRVMDPASLPDPHRGVRVFHVDGYSVASAAPCPTTAPEQKKHVDGPQTVNREAETCRHGGVWAPRVGPTLRSKVCSGAVTTAAIQI